MSQAALKSRDDLGLSVFGECDVVDGLDTIRDRNKKKKKKKKMLVGISNSETLAKRFIN